MPTQEDLHVNLIQRVNIGDTLTRSAARYPSRLALADGQYSLRYTELNAWVNCVANGLARAGYQRGNALAIASGNSAEFLVTYYACAKLGIVCVPVNLGWRAEEIAYVLKHSGARGIVVETQLMSRISEALAELTALTDVFVAPGTGDRWDEVPTGKNLCEFAELGASGSSSEPECFVDDRDPVSYLYTSGTTSFPKGVVSSHTGVYIESLSVALDAGFTYDDHFAAIMPMFHTAQLNGFCTSAIMVGGTLHVQRGFDANDLLGLIESESITQLFALPMMYRALLDNPALAETDLGSLRRACYAMAPMPDHDLKRCIDVFGCEFYLMFGQTEMSPVTTFFRPEHQLTHPGAIGTAVSNVQVAIMDESRRLVGAGIEGEIVYRGPTTMTGYLKDPDATATAFADGWFHSGDVGHFDQDGILWFSDRYKDVIKTGGENVASLEVEKAVYATEPGIAEVAVVGLPHERWSEAITAVVVPRPGVTLTPDGIIEGVKERADAYKAPKSVIVADALPKTSTGKIQKGVLRERYRDHYQASR